MNKVYKIGAIVTTLCVACIAIFTLTKNESVNPETVTPNKTIVSAAETKGSPENIKDISKEELKQKYNPMKSLLRTTINQLVIIVKRQHQISIVCQKSMIEPSIVLISLRQKIKVPFKSSIFLALQLL